MLCAHRLLALLPAVAAIGMGRPAAAEDAPALKLKLQPGTRSVHHVETTYTGTYSSASTPETRHKLQETMDIAMSVLKETADGGHELEFRIVAVKIEASGADRATMTFNSTVEDDDASGDPPAASLARLVNAPVRCVLGPDNGIVKVEGAKELMDELAGGDPQTKGYAERLLGPEAVKQFCRRFLPPGLPGKAVPVGTSWPVTVEAQAAGGYVDVLTLDYRYRGEETGQDRRCAALEFTGTYSTRPSADAKAPARPAPVVRDSKLTGKTWFDPALGVAAATEVDMAVTLEMQTGAAANDVWTIDGKQHVSVRLVEAGPIPPPPPPPKAPTEEDFKAWIRELGDDAYEKREAAMRRLRKAGKAARPFLQQVHTDDPEVQVRVQSLLKHSNPANENNAGAILKQLVNHESIWRQNDSDKNGVADYWTGDVAGLHCVHDANDKSLAVIPLALARADRTPGMAYAELGGVTAPFRGYWFQAMTTDQDGNPYVVAGSPQPTAKNAPARVATNPARFGFCAYPARYGEDGILTFIVDEDGVVWQKDLGPDAKGIDSRKEASPETAESGWSQFGG